MSFQAPFSITDMRRLQMAEAMQEQQQMQNNQQMVLNGLMQLGGAIGQQQDMKDKFMGTYNFLQEKNLVSPELDETVQGFVKRGDYGAASAYIQPYLAELDFGRKSRLAGRSGFFDSQGNWQMALRPEPVNPPNKEGYVFRSR